MTRIRSLYLPLSLACGLLLHGCGSTPEPKPAPRVAEISPQEQAARLTAGGEHEAAAEAWQALARSSSGTDAQAYLLRAANSLLDAGRLVPARELLGQLNIGLDTPLTARYMLASARLDIALKNAAGALDRLLILDPSGLDETEKTDYQSTLALAYALSGNYIEAARLRSRLDYRLLADEQARNANHDALWETLAQMPEATLLRFAAEDADNPLRGWLELAALVKRGHLESGYFETALARWQRVYPEHAGNHRIIPSLVAQPTLMPLRPKHIALLLPLRGAFANAAQAVRDGLLAAFYEGAAGADTQIRVYDSDASNILRTYHEAVGAGADFVIGPLEKDAVNALAAGADLAVPTLALNYAAPREQFPENLFQFGLSPEDEAAQVAEFAWLNGYAQGAAIYPNTAWGQRVFRAFDTRWRELGGTLVGERGYAANGQDFSEPVRVLLDVDASEARHTRLRHVLGEDLVFHARRRQDLDYVFMAGFPREVRQLRPQLRFFNASNVPVLATSHVFSGIPDPRADRDMDGIVFGDMPWTLDEENDVILKARLNQVWPESRAGLLRLYALGADALRLVAWLPRLQTYPFERFNGATGSARLDERGRIHRQLTWAGFRHGLPQVVEISRPEQPLLAPDAVPDQELESAVHSPRGG